MTAVAPRSKHQTTPGWRPRRWANGFAVMTLATLVTACGGGGGGSDTGTPPPSSGTPPPAAPQGFSVTADKTSTAPLESISFTLSSVGALPAGATPRFTVLADISGLGTFSNTSTIEIEGQYASGKVSVAAPILEFHQSTVRTNTRYDVRVRRESDSTLSNAITFTYRPITVPANRRGLPTTALQLALKALFEQASPVLVSQAPGIRPGYLTDSARALNVDTSLADIQAEAILQQAFGVSAIGAMPTSFSIQSANTAAQALRTRMIPESIKAGFNSIVSCLSDLITTFESSNAAAAEQCFLRSGQAVRDQIIPGFSDTTSTGAGIAATLTSLLKLGPRTAVGSYVQRMVMSAEMAELTTPFAQSVLAIPGVTTTPADAVDFALGKITAYGKSKLYDRLTRNLHETDQYLLEKVGAPEAFNETLSMAADLLARLNAVENSLVAVGTTADRLESLAESFGGKATEPTAPGQIPLGGFGSIPVGDGLTDAAAVCARYPEIGAGVAELGFASCEAYVRPFFDRAFLDTILPLLDRLPIAEMTACVSTPDSPACEQLFERVSAILEDLFDRISDYNEKDFHCERNYQEYEGKAGTRTCIFAELAYAAPPGACLPGSRGSPFDVGGAFVCVYYSRDYLQSGGTCRTKYSKVFFLGTDRCRWSTLPAARPAAYSINKTTGDRAVLEK